MDRVYTVGLYTLGCKVAQYETEAVAEAFAQRGFSLRPFDEVCDVYVINTCTVTAESDRKSRQIIRRARQTAPGALVMVCGCYAQTTPAAIAAIPGVDYISGTGRKMELPRVAQELLQGRPASPLVHVTDVAQEPFEAMRITHAPRTRAYVKIEDGCACRCTYCAIPAARGPVRSKPLPDVLQEVEGLARSGVQEVVLTGIETAAYGTDLPHARLIDLLEALDRMPGVPRVRLGSLSPELIRPDFISRFSRLHCVVPHLHLSMQSGADAVLHRMRRRYDRRMALEALAALRQAVPRIQFTTDMIVGFPGEREEDHAQTMDFAARARFLHMHVFPYSRRPGTPAATFPDQVPEAVKHARSAALIAAGQKIEEEILDACVTAQEDLPVLFETQQGGYVTGHTDTFMEVRVPAPVCRELRGSVAKVRPVRREGLCILGELVPQA